MEPSEGEFSSGSESGWTMYIDSPFHGEIYNHDDECTDFEECNDNNNNNDDDNNNDHHDDDDDGGESDDSMASDASSGPGNLQLLCVNSVGSHGHGMEHMKHAEDEVDDDKKFSMRKRDGRRQAKKSKYGRKVEEQPEEEVLLKADSADSHV